MELELSEVGGWSSPACDKLWLYNLHYFDDLNAENAASRVEWHRELLLHWVSENPPARGVGWEPYPVSLRIINWIKWSMAGNALPPECLHSLAVQTRYLSQRLEYHLLGNHLFSNAKALVFAGLFFEGKEASRWLEKGFSILAREIPEQILTDGGQFERSPMYHALALEDMLDLCNLSSAYADTVPQKWIGLIQNLPKTVRKMRQWLVALCHPDGEIAFFNDAAIGIAPAPGELERYAGSLDNVGKTFISAGLENRYSSELDASSVRRRVTQLSESGYLRVDNGRAVVLLDVAPVGPDYLPGHAHADTLCFELSLYEQRLFVNSGTSVYGQGEERQRQRGTAAHNTVVIDGENSSEIWAGFRVGRRANPSLPEIYESEDEIVVSASHDGYQWLPGKNRHWRAWCFNSGSLVVNDRITGAFRGAESRFHIQPDVKLEGLGGRTSILKLPQGHSVEIQVEGGWTRVEDDHWHPQFGVSVPNHCLVIAFNGHELKMTIRWNDH